ncbi:MAG: cytidylate kinase-like family protein [Oscillospiraceae bacterium]|nr:cytidylate kinase-like family protein [Oscillospiraceae bacterium]
MEKKMIITIGRQFGSGGYDVGRLLAEKLGIDFYDKELLGRAAKESGINPELFARADEQPTNSFLYSMSLGTVGLHTGFMATPDYLTNDKLFTLQSDTIRTIAEEHSCVIIGRCADYVLRDHPGLVSVFVHADVERRVARVMDRAQMTAEQARQAIKKTDRRRSSYYNYFTDRNWGGVDNYDLSVDVGRVGVEGAVELIAKFIELTR